jgi:hypothetical protein
VWGIVLLASAATLSARQISVAVLGSPFGGDPWNTDVQAKLQSTGLFSTVDVFNISNVTPTLAQLSSYQSVLVYTDAGGFADRTAFGNVLADYIDTGRGAVLATFTNASNSNDLLIGGRFNSDNYWALLPAPQSGGSNLTLGTVYEPGSPLLTNVNSFNGGGSSFHVPGVLHPSSVRVADWSNGVPLVVRRQIGAARTVALNFFPPSDTVRSDFWLAGTDGEWLMANALVHAAIPEPGVLSTVLVAGFAVLRRTRCRRQRAA